jgi:hypothetical protein
MIAGKAAAPLSTSSLRTAFFNYCRILYISSNASPATYIRVLASNRQISPINSSQTVKAEISVLLLKDRAMPAR